MIALARLACPEANIPSTTALATINPRNGRELGLQRGANVVMPNLTPLRYPRCTKSIPTRPALPKQESSAIAASPCALPQSAGLSATAPAGAVRNPKRHRGST